MNTNIIEIASGIYRISTFIERSNLVFNQFLVVADEPLLFHCGYRSLFPLVSGAVRRVIPLQTIRWVSYGHHEADESGAMNDWLGAGPHACVAVGAIGRMLSAARGSGTWRHLMCRTAGTPGCCMKRQRIRSFAAISSPSSGTAKR
jgi:flavorubredoxin